MAMLYQEVGDASGIDQLIPRVENKGIRLTMEAMAAQIRGDYSKAAQDFMMHQKKKRLRGWHIMHWQGCGLTTVTWKVPNTIWTKLFGVGTQYVRSHRQSCKIFTGLSKER